MLSYVTFDWTNILNKISLQITSGEFIDVDGQSIDWSPIPQLTACQSVDISHYFNLTKIVHPLIVFQFKKHPNLGITLGIKDKRKAPRRRTIKSNSLDYEGARIELKDLSSPKIVYYYITLSQTIDLETDKGKQCKNYPNQFFSSYRECDENFVYYEVKKYKIMPFWAAKNPDEITKIVYDA